MATKFTFFAGSDRVEIRIVEFENRFPQNDNDAVWLDSTVTVQAGAFIGSFKASFTTDDLVSLYQQLKSAITTLSGTVSFQNTGSGLALSITLDSAGRVAITGVTQPNRLRRGTLHFHIATDHFALIRALREMQDTLRALPTNQTINNNGGARK